MKELSEDKSVDREVGELFGRDGLGHVDLRGRQELAGDFVVLALIVGGFCFHGFSRRIMGSLAITWASQTRRNSYNPGRWKKTFFRRIGQPWTIRGSVPISSITALEVFVDSSSRKTRCTWKEWLPRPFVICADRQSWGWMRG